jgi:putative transposase
MPKKRFQPEEIIGKLRHADILLGQGKKIAEGVKALGVPDVTDSRGRQECGGMTTAQAKRLKELERENGPLRTIVADLPLDNRILQEAARGHAGAPPAAGRASRPCARGSGCPNGGRTASWGKSARPSGI